MINIYKLTAAQILAIRVDSPEQLFTGSKDIAHKEYMKLASKWHPREEHDGSTVAAHINALYDNAVKKLDNGVWSTPGRLRFTAVDGKSYEIRYKKHRSFELGDVYIGDKTIVYSIINEANDLYNSAIAAISKLKYADANMRIEISKCMPDIQAMNESSDRFYLVLNKPANLISLRDVVDYYGGTLDAKHVAWIMSRMYNLGCYLHYSHITHNDISIDSLYIDPANHSIALLGGWWYAADINKRFIALPDRTLQFTSKSILDKGVTDYHIDNELIHATGRELLGDIFGSSLNKNKDIPKAMLNWLQVPGVNIHDDFTKWHSTILIESFGAHKFVELNVTAKDIYLE